MTQRPTPPVLLHWEDTVKLLLETTEGFPKSMRRTLSERLEGHALDVFECLIRARFERKPRGHLEESNMRLDILRMLLRLCYERRILGEKRLRLLIERLDEVGRMIGGWLNAEGRR